MGASVVFYGQNRQLTPQRNAVDFALNPSAMATTFEASKHMKALVGFLSELGEKGVGLYEHHFDAQSFGSFSVVVGLPHDRLKFAWDGRDEILIVSVGKGSNNSGPMTWVHEMNISLPKGEGAERVYEEIASNTLDILAI